MTGTVHARFTEWDATYVLGALSPAERRDYEDHLDECERCRASVAELSAMPGLLGRLDAERGMALLAEPDDLPAAPADLVARIEARDRRRRLRSRVASIAGIAAAAIVATVLALTLPLVLAPSPAVALELTPVSQDVPVEAHVELTPEGWGTRIDMDCSYHPPAGADGGYGPVGYSMWVIGRDGGESQVSTWKIATSQAVRVNATTELGIGDIAEIEVRTAAGDRVLLSATVVP